MSQDVLERGLADILNAERSLRRIAEGVNAELRRVLTEIAYRTAGEALEARRRIDPSAPEAWSAGQWREFFSVQLDKAPPGWGDPGTGSKRINETAAQSDEITRRLSEALAEIERLREPQEGGDSIREIDPCIAATKLSADAGAHLWPEIPKRPPARFADRLSTGLRWRREALFLHLIATKGWSTRLEILDVVGRLFKVSPRSGSLKRAFDALIGNGLLVGDILMMALGRQSKLAVARLTEEGIELCRVLGWDPVEPEWERLNRFHEGNSQPAHTAGVLTFVYHARLRGWDAEVLPSEVSLETRPDVRLDRQEKRIFVEVEFDGDKPAKWRNLANLQGFVALCAPTPQKREGMVSDCKLAKLRGMATDLETLIQSSFPSSPLWAEEW